MPTLKLGLSQLMTLLYKSNGTGMAKLLRQDPGSGLSVTLDLSSWKSHQSILKTLENTLARLRMLLERQSQQPP